MQDEAPIERKPEPMSFKDQVCRVKDYEDVLTGPISLGIMLSEKRRG